LPRPVENDFTTPTTVSALLPIATAERPTINDASKSEMNALTLNRVTRRTSAPIASSAMSTSLMSTGVTAEQCRTKTMSGGALVRSSSAGFEPGILGAILAGTRLACGLLAFFSRRAHARPQR
jgi:hypothetical protein